MKMLYPNTLQKKADEGLDMLCKNGTITLDTIEKWGEEHMRISRK